MRSGTSRLVQMVAEDFTPRYVFGRQPAVIRFGHRVRGAFLLYVTLLNWQLEWPDLGRSVTNALVTAGVLAVVVPLSITILIVASPPERRSWTAQRAKAPVKPMALAALMAGAFYLGVYLTDHRSSLFILLVLALLPTIGLILIFVYFHHFNAADGHPLLPAMIAPWPILIMAATSADGSPLGWLTVGLTTAVSVWDFIWYARIGITITSGAPDLNHLSSIR